MARALPVLAVLLVLLVTGLVAGQARGAEPIWRLEQPPPPAGAPFKVPLGPPGDLQFIARNRGILATQGNSTVPRGLLTYDGESWRQLSTVCGGPSDTLRVAFAGQREFWTVSEPSRPRIGSGTTLCHFRDGEVVASFGTPPQDPDPYQPMNAATCLSPDDCWFGGIAGESPATGRAGAFRLHWDGAGLRSVVGPQGRGISDLEAHAGTVFQSVHVGPGAGDPAEPQLRETETEPRLLQRLVDGAFRSEVFVPAEREGVPADGTEMLGLDSDGAQLWAVGGGTASGPSAPEGGEASFSRPPLAARLAPGAMGFNEVELDPAVSFGPTERFVDVAALQGTSAAWVAVQRFEDRRSSNAFARVARIDASTGAVQSVRLPAAGGGRGSAARIACPAQDDCWLVTFGGWLFHLSDGSRPPRDDDPAYGTVITARPNEAAAQFVPDRPPTDDAFLLAPPPVEIETEVAPAPTQRKVRRLKPLLTRVRRRLKGRVLIVSFTLRRRAQVGLVASRKGRVVARARRRALRPGRRALRVRLNPRRYPTRLRFSVRERRRNGTGSGGVTGDTVTTGPAPDATATPPDGPTAR